MARRQFSYVDPHYCRVMLVKDTVAVEGPPAATPAGIVEAIWPKVELQPTETIWTVVLDARRRPLAFVQVSQGSLTSCLAFPREVFRPIWLANGAAFVLVHNHPSSDPSPSPEDHALTRRMREVAEIMGTPIIDHIIIGTRTNFFSYAQSGWPN